MALQFLTAPIVCRNAYICTRPCAEQALRTECRMGKKRLNGKGFYSSLQNGCLYPFPSSILIIFANCYSFLLPEKMDGLRRIHRFPSPSLSPVDSSLPGREPPIESSLCFGAVSSGFLLRHSRWTPTLNSAFSHHKTPEVFLCRCTVGLGTPSSGDGPGGSREGFPCFRGSPVTAAARDFWQVFFRSCWMIGKRGGSRSFPFSLPCFRRVGEAES